MSAPADIIPPEVLPALGAVAAIAIGAVVSVLATRAASRGLEVEKAVASKLDTLTALLSDLKGDVKLLGAELNTSRGALAEMNKRIDGLSASYGPRLASLEERVAVMSATPPRVRR